MFCLYCDNPTKVVNSRPQRKLKQVWRRRKCPNCGSLFTTTERIELPKALIIKSADGQTENFVREKLLLSVYASLGHRHAAVDDAIAITETICAKLLKSTSSPFVDKEHLVKIAYDTLNRFDKAAGVHYKAYYSLD